MKKWQTIVFWSLVYWVFSLLFQNLFKNVDESFRFITIIFTTSIAPLMLGLIVSLILKDNKGWIYGGVSYLLYFMWAFILGWMIELHFNRFAKHFLSMLKVYFYLGSVATLFAAFGGLIGDYIRKRRPS